MESILKIFLLHNKNKACLLITHVAIYYHRYVIRLHHRKTLKKLPAAIRSRIYIYAFSSCNSDALQLSYGRHVGIRPLIWVHVVIATKGSARSKKWKSILLKYFAFTSFACRDRFMKREKSERFPLPLSTF